MSPGKSYEGVAGGLLVVMLVALAALYYFNAAGVSWFVYALIIAIISIIGDLFVSVLKRRVQLKDTGNILPGHGGLLDRLDSLLAAAPFFFWLAVIQ